MNKRTSKAFGKKIFLLGKDEYGTLYWLEEPSWDCGWYWGFGYVRTYTNNKRPDLAKDITSHRHIDSTFIGEIDGCEEYVSNIFNAPLLNGGKTFTEKEGWELSELFSQFYTLKKSSELFYYGKSHIAPTSVKHDEVKCSEMYNFINKTMMPEIFKRIEEILTENK